jgi:hypothetical protein
MSSRPAGTMVSQEFSRGAGDATDRVDELPERAELSPVGFVARYWRWRGARAGCGPAAARGYRVGFGRSWRVRVSSARFEPHEYPYLPASLAASVALQEGLVPERFRQARVGLPLEYVGGVLAGRSRTRSGWPWGRWPSTMLRPPMSTAPMKDSCFWRSVSNDCWACTAAAGFRRTCCRDSAAPLQHPLARNEPSQ